MDVSRYADTLDDAGQRLGRAAAAAGLDATVPPCPKWQVRDLLRHVGGVHRWATSYLLTGLERPTTDDEDQGIFQRKIPDTELLGWYAEGHTALVEAVRSADPDLTCWTFMAAPSPLAFWSRRQAHETAIHCVDAESAAAWPSRFAEDFAADGIDELLCGFMARPGGRLVSDPPVALTLRTTDTGDSWTIHIGSERRTERPAAGSADCSIEGPASDLYQLLWNRPPATAGVTVEGNPVVLDLWRGKATVRWS